MMVTVMVMMMRAQLTSPGGDSDDGDSDDGDSDDGDSDDGDDACSAYFSWW